MSPNWLANSHREANKPEAVQTRPYGTHRTNDVYFLIHNIHLVINYCKNRAFKTKRHFQLGGGGGLGISVNAARVTGHDVWLPVTRSSWYAARRGR